MDYLRQLRNDEKRCTYSMVASLGGGLAATTGDTPLFVVPKRSTIARIYAVIKEPFLVGSSVTVSIYQGSESGDVLFSNLALDQAAGSVDIGPGDSAGRYSTEEHVKAVFNQSAVDSAVGEAYIVVEFTEVPVTAGAYTK